MAGRAGASGARGLRHMQQPAASARARRRPITGGGRALRCMGSPPAAAQPWQGATAGSRTRTPTPAAPPRCVASRAGAADKCIRVWTVEPSCGVARAERADAEYTSHTDTVTSVEWRPDHPDVMASASSSKADTNIRYGAARAGNIGARQPVVNAGLRQQRQKRHPLHMVRGSKAAS